MKDTSGNEIILAEYNTISDCKRAHVGHWFDADAIRFFRCTFPDGEHGVYKGIFLASRKFVCGDFSEPREYGVFVVDAYGEVRELAEYTTLYKARKALRALVQVAQKIKALTYQQARELREGIKNESVRS